MKQILIICIVTLLCSYNSKAQEKLPDDQKYEYFLLIKGANSKADIAVVASIFRSKAGVTYFETNKVSHKYFVLRSSLPIDKAACEAWLNIPQYNISIFAEDIQAKEDLVIKSN